VDDEEAATALSAKLSRFIEPASSSLLFSITLQLIRAEFWTREATEAMELFQTYFPDAFRLEEFRDARRLALGSRDWRKNKLSQFFASTGGAAPQILHKINIGRRVRGQDMATDWWLVLDTVAAGSTRDVALQQPFKNWRLTPFLSVAARLEVIRQADGHADTARWAAMPGRFFDGLDTQEDIGLPMHIHAPLFLCGSLLSAFTQARAGGMVSLTRQSSGLGGSYSSVGAGAGGVEGMKKYIYWNTNMLSAVFEKLLPTFLASLRDIALESRDGRGFYAFWPYVEHLQPRIRQIQGGEALASILGQGNFFLLSPPDGYGRTEGGPKFLKPNEAHFITQNVRAPVEG